MTDKYVIYCDESRHDDSHPYMAIGGLWVPAEQKQDISREFRKLCKELGVAAEVKWSKTSSKPLNAYKRLVDFFFEQKALRFRAILVEQSRVDIEKFHGGDSELGFYKFYYEMLIKWLLSGNEYLVLLDFKQNKGADRYMMLRRVLERKLLGTAWISDLTVIDSRETPLAQLCDLLTGAVAAAWCDPLEGSAKKDLIDYIGRQRKAALTVPSTNPDVCKFNVFKIDLR